MMSKINKLVYNPPCCTVFLFQIHERIHEFARRKLSRLSSVAEQIYFVDDTETVLSHSNNGDWPSGKAADSGSAIGGSNPSSPAILKCSPSGGLFSISSWDRTP